MESGYNIVWTDNALSELRITYRYIEENWTEKELIKLSEEIERTISLISKTLIYFLRQKAKKSEKLLLKN